MDFGFGFSMPKSYKNTLCLSCIIFEVPICNTVLQNKILKVLSIHKQLNVICIVYTNFHVRQTIPVDTYFFIVISYVHNDINIFDSCSRSCWFHGTTAICRRPLPRIGATHIKLVQCCKYRHGNYFASHFNTTQQQTFFFIDGSIHGGLG